MLKGQVGRILFARILEDEDLPDAVKRRVEQSGVKAGMFIIIGSLKKVTLGYFEEGAYKTMRLGGPLEIASCMGNIAVDERDQVIIHAHVVVSDDKGQAFGGHLMKDSPVGVTAELVIIEGKGVDLRRSLDEKTGLRLLKSG